MWTVEAESALNVLKTALTSASVLYTSDFTIPFIIQADSSGKGVGAVLVQGVLVILPKLFDTFYTF